MDQAPVKGYSKATQQMQHTYTNPSRVYPPFTQLHGNEATWHGLVGGSA